MLPRSQVSSFLYLLIESYSKVQLKIFNIEINLQFKKTLKNNGGESGIRTHDTVSRIHTFQACAENLAACYQRLFNHVTAIIELDCDHSESRFLTQIWSQIVVDLLYEKTFRDLGSGFVVVQCQRNCIGRRLQHYNFRSKRNRVNLCRQ